MKKQKRKEKERKEKEKRHTKQLCKSRYESTGTSEAGGPRMDPVGPTPPIFLLFSEKVIKISINPTNMLSFNRYHIREWFLGGAGCAHLFSKGFRRSWKSSCHSLLFVQPPAHSKKDELTLFPLGKDTFYHSDSILRDRA